MIPSLANVDPVLQMASGVFDAVQKANAPRPWPNAYESLVELYVILDEWCRAARESNDDIRARIMGRRYGGVQAVTGVTFHGPVTQSRSFVSTMLEDSERLLRPGAPWLQKWS
jgi:hypothetical protein